MVIALCFCVVKMLIIDKYIIHPDVFIIFVHVFIAHDTFVLYNHTRTLFCNLNFVIGTPRLLPSRHSFQRGYVPIECKISHFI